jgi:hypothetical protein
VSTQVAPMVVPCLRSHATWPAGHAIAPHLDAHTESARHFSKVWLCSGMHVLPVSPAKRLLPTGGGSFSIISRRWRAELLAMG